MSEPAIKLETRSLFEVAKQCLDASGDDRAKAAKYLRAEIDADSKLYRQLVEPLIDSACWEQIRLVARTERRPYWRSPNPDNVEGLGKVAKAHVNDWLSYRMSNGKVLGRATKDDVLSEADMHDLHAKSNALRARLYRGIADAMGDAAFVQDALTNDRIEKIREEVSDA